MTATTKSAKETGKLASKIARKLIGSEQSSKAQVIALEGELGAGKTTFVKAFLAEFGVKDKVTSPTFVLLKKYSAKANSKFRSLIHVDAYRLRDHRELESIGLKDMMSDPRNILLIEWAERVEPILPKNIINIHIDHIEKDERKIHVTGIK
ncbi:MAG: tRNA (adenosine(37)-N6)-threonylcarbamoyltransferase complex ATPase subunit type 1 TsaE [Candidatus Paceibacterota bacterium]